MVLWSGVLYSNSSCSGCLRFVGSAAENIKLNIKATNRKTLSHRVSDFPLEEFLHSNSAAQAKTEP